MHRLAAAALLGLLLAGCAATHDPPAASAPSPTASLGIPAAVPALKCSANCWEPAIAIDGAGRIFVTLAQEPGLAVSTDGGASFTDVGKPPLPSGAPAGLLPGDATVATSPDGRLFYYAFLAEPTGLVLPAPVGIQVAVSKDAGRTWDCNVFLSALNGPSQPVVSPWKSWLGFGPGGTVYMDWNSRGTGLWSARSDDGGATWTQFTKVSPADDRIISVFMGPPVVDAQGRVYVAYFGAQTPNEPNPFLPQGHELRVATSDDKGATWAQHVVARSDVPGYVGSYFPALAIDPAGRLALANWDPDGHMQVRASLDRGATWGEPVQWSGANATDAAPWLAASGDQVALMYYESGGMALARGAFSPAGLGPPVKHRILAAPSGGGDFMHFALDAHGRAVVPVPDADKHVLSVVTGPAWT